MKIQCDNCAILHELDPPAWVVSSGRPFRFRCSSCGHSQSVMPQTLPEDTPLPAEPQQPVREPTPAPAPRIARKPPPTPAPESGDGAVFLKQNGQIYMVRDWDTLKRWITERRVDRHDLVSEGGVRWEPIGSRRDLAHLFGPTLAPHADDVDPDSIPAAPAVLEPSPSLAAPTPSPSPSEAHHEPVHLGGDMPFGHEMPFMGASTGAVLQGAWHDDDTEGIPTGLPALPRQLGPNSRQRTGESEDPHIEEDPEDAFGENPSYALPPPSSDPLADTPMGAITSAGGMTYVAPDNDSPLPAPSASDIPTAPPPSIAVPSAFGNAPKGDDGWDPLMVADPASLKETPFGEVPTQARRVEISEPSYVTGVEDSVWPPPATTDLRQLALAFTGAALVVMLLLWGFRDTLLGRDQLPVPSPEPDAELGAVLDEPKPVPATPEAAPTTDGSEGQDDGSTEALADGEDDGSEPQGGGTDGGAEIAVADVKPEPAPEPAAPAPPTPAPVAPAPAAPAPVVPKPAAPKPVAPQPAAPKPAAPKPAPKPASEPVWDTPPAPRPTSLSALIRDGWDTVESDPKTASDHFARALEIYASHAEANYGYGYAQLQLGNTGKAKEPLCTALSRGSADVRREVGGLLTQHALSCED